MNRDEDNPVNDDLKKQSSLLDSLHLLEPILFKGSLQSGSDRLSVTFSASIDQSGKVVFDFTKIELNQDWNPQFPRKNELYCNV